MVDLVVCQDSQEISICFSYHAEQQMFRSDPIHC